MLGDRSTTEPIAPGRSLQYTSSKNTISFDLVYCEDRPGATAIGSVVNH
jgi:hypothetical protein